MVMPLPTPYVLVSVLYAAPFERTRVIFLTNFILFGCCFCTLNLYFRSIVGELTSVLSPVSLSQIWLGKKPCSAISYF
jgi:hypothetical protein